MSNQQPISTFLGIAAAALLATSASGFGVNPCPEDTNRDGDINVLDLIELLLCFGQPNLPPCTQEDINEDGNVNVLDLIQLLLHFGEACPKPPVTKDVCDGAEAIVLASPPQPQTIKIINTTVGATPDIASACTDDLTGVPVPVVAPGVWYSVIGDGTTLTATTCNVNTIGYDTALSVYCGPCDNLVCVGASADDFSCPIWPLASTVSWCSVPGQTYLILVHGATPVDVGSFGLEITSDGIVCPPVPCAPPGPANDPCSGRVPILDGLTPFNTLGASTDGAATNGLGDCVAFGDPHIHNDVWYNYTASATGTVTVSTCNDGNPATGDADYDTKIAIYDGCNTALCPFGGNELGCNDDGVGCAGFTSIATATVAAGNCYKIRVGGFGVGFSGTGNLAVSVGP